MTPASPDATEALSSSPVWGFVPSALNPTPWAVLCEVDRSVALTMVLVGVGASALNPSFNEQQLRVDCCWIDRQSAGQNTSRFDACDSEGNPGLMKYPVGGTIPDAPYAPWENKIRLVPRRFIRISGRSDLRRGNPYDRSKFNNLSREYGGAYLVRRLGLLEHRRASLFLTLAECLSGALTILAGKITFYIGSHIPCWEMSSIVKCKLYRKTQTPGLISVYLPSDSEIGVYPWPLLISHFRQGPTEYPPLKRPNADRSQSEQSDPNSRVSRPTTCPILCAFLIPLGFPVSVPTPKIREVPRIPWISPLARLWLIAHHIRRLSPRGRRR